jgi:hypothetical protein
MTLEDVRLWWSLVWLAAAAGAWMLLCRVSADALGRVLARAALPTGLAVLLVSSLAYLEWSFRPDGLDGFLLPVLVFCTALVLTSGALRALKRLDRSRRAQRWIAGSLVAVYLTAQAAACALCMLGVALDGLGEGPELSAGPLGAGYFYRQSLGGFLSTFIVTRVVWVPPLLPFLEREVAFSAVNVTDRSGTPTILAGGGFGRLDVLYGGEVVDRLAY